MSNTRKRRTTKSRTNNPINRRATRIHKRSTQKKNNKARLQTLINKLGGTSNASFNFSKFIEQLMEKFGPALTEILLELLIKKSDKSLIPSDLTGAFDTKNLLLLLLDKFGPTIVVKLAEYLEKKEDLFSKLAAMALREYGDELLDMLVNLFNSPAGADIVSSLNT
jgi:uncharacterized protein YcgL (UPF0745 family)